MRIAAAAVDGVDAISGKPKLAPMSARTRCAVIDLDRPLDAFFEALVCKLLIAL